MKAQTKAIVASMVVIALALAAVSGVTYSWFSDTESSDINVSTAKIDIEGAFTTTTVTGAGSGSTSTTTSGNNLVIRNLIAATNIESTYSMINKSTISTIYRMYVSIDGDDLPVGITLSISGTNNLLNTTKDLTFTNGIAYIVGGSTSGVTLPVGATPYEFAINLTTTGEFSSSFNSSIKIVSEAYQPDYNYTEPQVISSTGEAAMPSSATTDVTFKGTAPASGNAEPAEVEVIFSKDAVQVATNGADDVTLKTEMVESDTDGIAKIRLTLSNGETSFDGNYVTVSVNIPGQYDGIEVVYTGTGDQPILLGCSYNETTGFTKVTFKTNHFSDFKIKAKGQYFLVDSAKALVDAIMSNTQDVTIILKQDGEEAVEIETNFSIPAGKNVTIIGNGDRTKIVLSGQIADTTNGKLTLKNLSVNVDGKINDGTNISQTGATAIALWGNVDFFAYDVIFNMSLADSTAITAWWSTNDGANITVKNCVFNCNGQRPIRSDASVTVDGCTFNDPYRYAVQMTSKANTITAEGDAIVNFFNNTINTGTTTDKPVYGVQLEGKLYGCSNLMINGSNNKINLGGTGKTGHMYYCDCGLNSCEFNKSGKTATITWNTEVSPTHKAGIAIYNSDDLRNFADMVNAGNKLEGTTVILMNDIDLNKEQWVPIGNVAGYPSTTFAGTFDGNGKTISNFIASDFTPNHATAGFFGSTTGTIKDLTIKDATISSSHYAGGICGYSSGYNTEILNCHVIGCTITSTAEYTGTAYDNGDKVGGIIGHIGATDGGSTLNNCTVNDTKIQGYRDLGGIAGYSGIVINGCSVNGITLIQDLTHDYKSTVAVRDTVGPLVGNGERQTGNNIIGTVTNQVIPDTGGA